jgi:2'-5' RNA ligase
VRTLLDAQAVPYDMRPFAPHITLLRQAVLEGPPQPLPEAFACHLSAPRLIASSTAPRSGGHGRYAEVGTDP